MTLVTEFESGAEQRRSKWDHPKASLRFQFDKSTFSHNDLADIWRFYKAQGGMLRTFEVPTFGQIATVASEYPGIGTTLGVSDSQDFATAVGSRWNRIWVENAAGGYQVFSVSSKVSASRIEVSVATNSETLFAIGDSIFPVLKVRFGQRVQGFEYLPMLLGTLGVEFTEVSS
jgi:hypothetical protein